MEAPASALAMTQQPDRQLDPSLPNAARMQAIGDLLARGIRRLSDELESSDARIARPIAPPSVRAKASVSGSHASRARARETGSPTGSE